jgi:hypothetical protein
MSEGAPEGQTGGDGGAGPGGTGEPDYKARFEALGGEEAEKWKTLSRKNEEDFKKASREAQRNAAAAEELRRLKESGQSHEEKLTSLAAAHESLTKEHQTIASERESLKVEVSRLRAGLAAGLTLDDMQYIPLGDEEGMVKAAKTLAQRLGTARTPDFDGGGRGGSPEPPKTFGGVIRNLRDQQRGGPAS